MTDLSRLTTEARNPNTMKLDQMKTRDIIKTINHEDQQVALAVEQVLPQVERAIENIYQSLKNGGRLFYVGAGTSGRLGVIDAAECPPTFLTSKDLVQTVMAGGREAFLQAAESNEDDEGQGKVDLQAKQVTDKDVIIGITASGRTPYPIGALKYANEVGAYTIALTCNEKAEISAQARLAIEVVVGPEVLTGSTRMKAATAHKMILNMISTTVMVKLGKVYENLMVDVHASNYKLVERARRIIMEITGVSYEQATTTLEESQNEVKPAIVMIEANVPLHMAKQAIRECGGYVRKAIEVARGMSG
ncbi:N-acetylmuramic acid 6-phosphate etherase [Salirhabdus sp. Marseille-P4669]|uniref:N-acetylmuramic acid 6-phosphate etherase n=1 Tax=Salirhabdus sp. Marseille-P4669 TaxID=2042310 RepID=UPI000C7B2356|nr:N-acetylmuramic acid 6-phosphate etherase [Salirhabdus sp. Marseille-P4669]